MINLFRYQSDDGGEPFTEWLKVLRDKVAQARIQVCLRQVQAGNFGDAEPVGDGVSELRIHVGAGYRVYYGRHGKTVVPALRWRQIEPDGGHQTRQGVLAGMETEANMSNLKGVISHHEREIAELRADRELAVEYLRAAMESLDQPEDWSRNYTPLDKELHKVVRDAAMGQRRADALMRVTGRDGAEDWVLVHVEVQGENTADFARRMFVYNYRSYDLYGRPVIRLAVLGEPYPAACGKFGYGRWGSLPRLRFPVVSPSAYRSRWAELEASANPFAVVTQAHLQARRPPARTTPGTGRNAS